MPKADNSLFAELLPDLSELEIRGALLDVEQIVDDDDGTQPSESFMQSVLNWGGVYHALDVVPVKTRSKVAKYAIVNGRRRLRALRTLRELTSETARAALPAWIKAVPQYETKLLRLSSTVPAAIVTGFPEGLSLKALALMLNAQRSENFAHDAEALKGLYDLGYSEADVFKLTGLRSAAQKQRNRLNELIPALAEAWRASQFPQPVAEAAAKLPKVRQKALAVLIRNRLRGAADGAEGVTVGLTLADVREARLAQKTAAVGALGAELFEPETESPTSRAEKRRTDYARARHLVAELLKLQERVAPVTDYRVGLEALDNELSDADQASLPL